MMTYNQPSNAEYQSVHNYLDNKHPIKADQRAYIRHKEDLVTLRPGREHAWLDKCIEHGLRMLHRPFPWINVSLCLEVMCDSADVTSAVVLLAGEQLERRSKRLRLTSSRKPRLNIEVAMKSTIVESGLTCVLV